MLEFELSRDSPMSLLTNYCACDFSFFLGALHNNYLQADDNLYAPNYVMQTPYYRFLPREQPHIPILVRVL